MGILDCERDKLRRDRAELHRLCCHALSSLEEFRILPLTTPHGADDLRHHPVFKVIVKDVSSGERDAAGTGPSQLRAITVEARHVIRRIACPALSTDILIEPAVSVSHDVETRDLLFL